jgi:Subtilase family
MRSFSILHMRNRTFAALAICTLTFATKGDAETTSSARTGCPPPETFGELAYIDAVAGGTYTRAYGLATDTHVKVLLAVRPGRTDDARAAIDRVNGRVVFSVPVVGYIEAELPFESVRRLSSEPAIQAVQVDSTMPTSWVDTDFATCFPAPATELTAPAPRIPPKPREPLTVDAAKRLQAASRALVGIERLRKMHPTYDGRGVTIAMLEVTGVPVEHPAFASALDRHGRPIRKVHDLVLMEPGWRAVALSEPVTLSRSAPTASIDGTTYRFPGSGIFRTGIIVRGRARYGVVWDSGAERAWIDLNQDRDFSNDLPLRDARRAPDRGTFPEDGASGRAFRVSVDPQASTLTVHPSPAAHPAMVGSIAAGATGDDNVAAGIAPGARLVVINPVGWHAANVTASNTWGHVLRAVLYAAARSDVDIIHMSLALDGTPLVDRGVAGTIVDRAIAYYDKPVITSGGNAWTREAANSVGSLMVSVGAHVPGEVARDYFGYPFTGAHAVFDVSARGPRTDGESRPDLVAPSMIGAAPCGTERVGTRLPACYDIGNSTSTAAPVVTGVVAALISGAHQRGFTLPATRIRSLLRATARFLPGLQAADQGAGLPQADAAWALVERRISWPRITSEARLQHAFAPFLQESNGVSLYEREGWTAGDRGTRTLTLTRHTGPAGPRAYRLVWSGNDGTFATAERIWLTRGHATKLRITVSPSSGGTHSALLSLVDSEFGIAVYQQQLTVVAAETLGDSNGFRLQRAGVLSPLARVEIPVRLPPRTHALRIAMRASSNVTLNLVEPQGWTYEQGTVLQQARRPWGRELIVPHPSGGTWLVTLALRPGRVQPEDYDVEISALSLAANLKSSDEPPSSDEITVTLAQQLAGDGLQPEVRLGLRQQSIANVSNDDVPYIHEFMVRPGTSALDVSARGLDAGIAVILVLYECATSCRRVDAAVQDTPMIRVEDPREGRWKAVIVPQWSSAAGRIQIETVASDPLLGELIPLDKTGDGSTSDFRFRVANANISADTTTITGAVGSEAQLVLTAALKSFDPAAYQARSLCGSVVPPGVSLLLPPSFPRATARRSVSDVPR